MLPIPDHLPQTEAVDHVDRSLPDNAITPSDLDSNPDVPAPFLDMSGEPGPSRWTMETASRTRQSLATAVIHHRTANHHLLLDNFARLSSHIHLASASRSSTSSISKDLTRLRDEIDPQQAESFLSPVISNLNRHFTASFRRHRAIAHLEALKEVQDQTIRLARLERAVLRGQGADNRTVHDIKDLDEHRRYPLHSTLATATKMRSNQIQNILLAQITDALEQAISFHRENGQMVLRILASVSLPSNSDPLPDKEVQRNSLSFPTYTLSDLFTVLSRLGGLSGWLSAISDKLLKLLVRPLLKGYNDQPYLIRMDIAELSLIPTQSASPLGIISDLERLLAFIPSIFPTSGVPLPERRPWLVELHSMIFRLVLDELILPIMPQRVSSIEAWLSACRRATELESGCDLGLSNLKSFTNDRSAVEWLEVRSRLVSDTVKRLVKRDWASWEAKEVEKDKTAAVNTETEDMETNENRQGRSDAEDQTQALSRKEGATPSSVNDDGDMGWDFDLPTATTSPSSPPSEAGPTVGDGWDFSTSETQTGTVGSPATTDSIKPLRQAKRLGRRLDKRSRFEQEDSANQVSKVAGQQISVLGESDGAAANDGIDGWEWDEPVRPPSGEMEIEAMETPASSMPTRWTNTSPEQRKAEKESYVISRTCHVLLDLVEDLLSGSTELQNASLPHSFSSLRDALKRCASDALDMFRSMLLTQYLQPLRGVPTLAMQLSNDLTFLADSVAVLGSQYSWDNTDVIRRLRSAAEHAFEHQVSLQREGLMAAIDEAREFRSVGEEGVWSSCESIVRGVASDLANLGRVIKVVLPSSSYLDAMGHLVDVVVHRLSNEILALGDITELESERLNALLKMMRPLETLFPAETPQASDIASYVPHWLKYCYTSELLEANLVDILYLFDTKALVDFTTQELVGVIKALFADSEKRDSAIERIELRSHTNVL